MVIRDFRSMAATFACAALFNLLSFWVFAADEPSDGVGTRGIDARMAAEPTARMPASKASQKLPPLASTTRNFEVVGPESDSLGFAVTQPGPIRIDVQTQGAPIVVTLQSPGHAPIVQQGSGALSLGYDVTAGDVEKSLLWSVQVRLIEPPPQRGVARAAPSLRNRRRRTTRVYKRRSRRPNRRHRPRWMPKAQRMLRSSSSRRTARGRPNSIRTNVSSARHSMRRSRARSISCVAGCPPTSRTVPETCNSNKQASSRLGRCPCSVPLGFASLKPTRNRPHFRNRSKCRVRRRRRSLSRSRSPGRSSSTYRRKARR